MKQLPEILPELQALATVTEDQFETALAAVVTDVQALIAAAPATVADPVATVVVTTVAGVVTTCVPQA